MKAPNEKEIQRLLDEQLKENGEPGLLSSVSKEDEELYKLLFTTLADEPTDLQNVSLAEGVIKKIKAKEQKAESLRYLSLIAATLILGLLYAYCATYYISQPVLTSILSFIADYKWIFLFIICSVIIIEIADKNLVKRKSAVLN
jgi:hypothetical protein